VALNAAADLAAVVLLAAAPTSPQAGESAFGTKVRERILERTAALIESKYVDKAKARAIAAEVRGLGADRELMSATPESAWSAALTRRLCAHDVHFQVSWTPPRSLDARSVPPSRLSPAEMDELMAHDNFGFKAVERLAGNIGYVNLAFFAHFDRTLTGTETPKARRTAEAALTLLSQADAVIFDLRENMGGSPAMVDLLLTGFFGADPVLLNRFYEREGDRTLDFSTFSNYQGPRRPDAPVYVLISGATVSAAEEFAYDVQAQRRGVIVGDVSAGGANPGRHFDLGDGFDLFVSTGAAINPITKTNWEGTGVKPDVLVPAALALTRARALALDAVLSTQRSSAPIEAQWALDRLKAEQSGFQLSPDQKDAYAADFGDRVVKVQGGDLVLIHGRAPAQRLVPVARDVFSVDEAPDQRVTFERDEHAVLRSLVISTSSGAAATYTRNPRPAEGARR